MGAKFAASRSAGNAQASASLDRFHRLVRFMVDVLYYGICTLAMLMAAATILYGEWL